MADKKRVLHVTCRVIGREVESLKDVPVVLHLGPYSDAESEVTEDPDDLIANEIERVATSCRYLCS